jgi:hypothetical protein
MVTGYVLQGRADRIWPALETGIERMYLSSGQRLSPDAPSVQRAMAQF